MVVTDQPAWHSTAAGIVGAFCCVYSGLPFDTCKVRMQGSAVGTYRNVLHCAAVLARKEGFFAFYKGAIPALASATTENSVLFTANTLIRQAWMRTTGGDQDRPMELWEMACVGGISGMFSATSICPAEQVKCRLQMNTSIHRLSPLQTALGIVREGGVLSLFRGLGPLLLRDIPFNFIFFGAYETTSWALMHAFVLPRYHKQQQLLQQQTQQIKQQPHTQAGSQNSESTPEQPPKPALLTVFAGGIAGGVAWAIIYPIDVLKTRIQTGAGGRGALWRNVCELRALGVRTVYAGVTAAVLRALPANGALFLGYELTARLLRDLP